MVFRELVIKNPPTSHRGEIGGFLILLLFYDSQRFIIVTIEMVI